MNEPNQANAANDKVIFGKHIDFPVSWHSVNGRGEAVKITISGGDGFSGFTGKRYGTPRNDCTACHSVLTGGAVACNVHKIYRKVEVI